MDVVTAFDGLGAGSVPFLDACPTEYGIGTAAIPGGNDPIGDIISKSKQTIII
jgi:hypothetical protein